MLPIAVFVSGSGSNLQSIIDKMEQGALHVDIRLVLSNKPDAYGLERARKHGLPTVILPHGDYPDRNAYDEALLREVDQAQADVIALAGFMRILGPTFVSSRRNHIVNIHPAILPSFKGIHGQQDAADYGVTLSGATVHLVDEKMDHGPIIIQAAVPAYPDDDGDSLGKRILALEHRIYPQALQWIATDRLKIEGRKTRIEQSEIPQAAMTTPCLVNPPLEEGF
ncbi:phosphoribosylglycinamide formyltransferase [Desulfovibrio inopinatus]|uniref:phosphoribosylglycinamide formyltransferase n=1 Tax=Desulfovibrio inopinatus TaxID=102109 RepID=UPI0004180600|nr:phosphoribosylglycinamide formyltransferase [Desulfovibrio inopinatus]